VNKAAGYYIIIAKQKYSASEFNWTTGCIHAALSLFLFGFQRFL
jgi:hypothetical protein